MPSTFSSFTNAFIPGSSTTAEITANLVVNYARNQKDYNLNRYSTITPVSKPAGFYTRLAAGASIRLNPTTGYGYSWTPGQKRPLGEWNKLGHLYVPYNTFQYAYSTTLPLQTVETADWAIQPSHFAMISSQAMTNRAFQMASVATNTANYPSLHTSTATALAGGFLGSGTSANPFLQKAIQQATIRISKSTGGMVSNPRQLVLITNPNGAAQMSRAEETRTALIQQVDAIKMLQGDEPTNAERFNIPDRYYGCQIIVEDSVYNSGEVTAEDEIANSQYVWPDNSVLICARGKDLLWPEGAVGNPSTLGIFEYEAMNAQTKSDDWNRLVDMSVAEQFQCQVVAPLTGFLITNAFS